MPAPIYPDHDLEMASGHRRYHHNARRPPIIHHDTSERPQPTPGAYGVVTWGQSLRRSGSHQSYARRSLAPPRPWRRPRGRSLGSLAPGRPQYANQEPATTSYDPNAGIQGLQIHGPQGAFSAELQPQTLGFWNFAEPLYQEQAVSLGPQHGMWNTPPPAFKNSIAQSFQLRLPGQWPGPGPFSFSSDNSAQQNPLLMSDTCPTTLVSCDNPIQDARQASMDVFGFRDPFYLGSDMSSSGAGPPGIGEPRDLGAGDDVAQLPMDPYHRSHQDPSVSPKDTQSRNMSMYTGKATCDLGTLDSLSSHHDTGHVYPAEYRGLSTEGLEWAGLGGSFGNGAPHVPETRNPWTDQGYVGSQQVTPSGQGQHLGQGQGDTVPSGYPAGHSLGEPAGQPPEEPVRQQTTRAVRSGGRNGPLGTPEREAARQVRVNRTACIRCRVKKIKCRPPAERHVRDQQPCVPADILQLVKQGGLNLEGKSTPMAALYASHGTDGMNPNTGVSRVHIDLVPDTIHLPTLCHGIQRRISEGHQKLHVCIQPRADAPDETLYKIDLKGCLAWIQQLELGAPARSFRDLIDHDMPTFKNWQDWVSFSDECKNVSIKTVDVVHLVERLLRCNEISHFQHFKIGSISSGLDDIGIPLSRIVARGLELVVFERVQNTLNNQKRRDPFTPELLRATGQLTMFVMRRLSWPGVFGCRADENAREEFENRLDEICRRLHYHYGYIVQDRGVQPDSDVDSALVAGEEVRARFPCQSLGARSLPCAEWTDEGYRAWLNECRKSLWQASQLPKDVVAMTTESGHGESVRQRREQR
ncbi:uncharacterized protein F5Z01DRAFT_690385 [Emericellopsis atlantica]|uniref:Uncharacterized protein n=1 Tax=Emericellopsis atlantica TaxID=2614577 RepID=A0A9P7ZIZ3_9HYPO|nr:uncharacterized protein F5Z01DRAFT_690385 [Emericellopsis atlantica]KAG9252652.1 hypothetical protein F5Z01DRAFT_690385 [Emericellopsis atlantica]